MSSYALGRTHGADYADKLSLADAMRYLRLLTDEPMRARRRAYVAGYTDALLERIAS